MAHYSTVSEVVDKFANLTGLGAEASLGDWELALENLCAAREQELTAARIPALRNKAKLELADARHAWRFAAQKSLFEKLNQFIKEGSKRRYDGLLDKPESKELLPKTAEATYDDWLAVQDRADKLAAPAAPPLTPVVPAPPPPPPPTPVSAPTSKSKPSPPPPPVRPTTPPSSPALRAPVRTAAPASAEASAPVTMPSATRLPTTKPPSTTAPDTQIYQKVPPSQPPPEKPPRPRSTWSVALPLSVSITTPVEGSVIKPGETIVIRVKTKAPGEILTVQILENGRAIGECLDEPYTMDWTPATTGAYSLTAEATDKYGQRAVSPAVHINIQEETPGAPANFSAKAMIGKIVLSWESPPGYRAVGYKVERAVADSSHFESLTPRPVPELNVTDANVQNGTSYSYRVVALGANHRQGPPASVVSATSLPPPRPALPAITIVSPVEAATVLPGTSILLSTSVTAPAGIATVEFFQNNRKIGSIGVEPYALHWKTENEGSCLLKAVVTDTIGQKAESPPVKIMVEAAAASPLFRARGSWKIVGLCVAGAIALFLALYFLTHFLAKH